MILYRSLREDIVEILVEPCRMQSTTKKNLQRRSGRCPVFGVLVFKLFWDSHKRLLYERSSPVGPFTAILCNSLGRMKILVSVFYNSL